MLHNCAILLHPMFFDITFDHSAALLSNVQSRLNYARTYDSAFVSMFYMTKEPQSFLCVKEHEKACRLLLFHRDTTSEGPKSETIIRTFLLTETSSATHHSSTGTHRTGCDVPYFTVTFPPICLSIYPPAHQVIHITVTICLHNCSKLWHNHLLTSNGDC